MKPRLYSYWRSSAAYRVRIALGLKEIDYDIVPVSLHPDDSEQHSDDYTRKNPQQLVPFYEDENVSLAQSTAILEYLEEQHTDISLLPRDPQLRGQVRAACQHIACDVHPLNNLRVLVYLRQELGVDDGQFNAWYAHWIHTGFRALEQEAAGQGGPFMLGEYPSLVDCYLVPQLYNARRFKVPLDDFPTIVRIADHCNTLPAFDEARPEIQPDFNE